MLLCLQPVGYREIQSLDKGVRNVTTSTRSQEIESESLLLRALATLCLICGSAGLVVIGELIWRSIAGRGEAGLLTPVWAVLNLGAWLIASRALWRWALGRESGHARWYGWIYGGVLNTLWFYRVWFEPFGLTGRLRTAVAAATLAAFLMAAVGLCVESWRAKR